MPGKSGASELAALARFSAKLHKDFGESRAPVAPQVRDILSTTSLELDWALRRGGLEMGAIYEIVGAPGCFKTSLVTRILAQAQRQYPYRGVSYVDLEGTFRDDWAEQAGLDVSQEAIDSGRWQHVYPENSEDASDMVRAQARSGVVSLAVIDSVGGMESKKVFAKKADESTIAANAKVITPMTKELATLTRQNNCTIIMVNQYRANMKFDMPLSAGPLALQYATTAKIEMSLVGGADGVRKMKFGDSEEPVSKRTRCRVSRLKTGAEGRRAEFWFNVQPSLKYGPVGIFAADEAMTMGIKYGVIERGGKGSWYTVPGAEAVNGRDAVTKLLMEREDLLAAVRKGVLAASPDQVVTIEEDEDA